MGKKKLWILSAVMMAFSLFVLIGTESGSISHAKSSVHYATSAKDNRTDEYKTKNTQNPPNITTQPKSVTVNSGSTAKFSVKSDTYGVKYQWQLSSNGGKTWKTSQVSGNKTECINVKASEGKDGYQYRCKVYVGSKYKYSNAVTLKVRPTITTQPKGKIVECDSKVKYTVKSGFSDVKYQWQYSADGGKTWKTSGATGNKTATLTVSGKANHHGYYYRCKVSSKSGAYRYSKKAVLRIKPKITLQPKSVSVIKGSNAVFTIDAKGANLKYQWQVSSDGGKNWHNTTVKGNKTKKITVKAKADQNGRRYRCVVSNGSIKTCSNAAKLTVNSKDDWKDAYITYISQKKQDAVVPDMCKYVSGYLHDFNLDGIPELIFEVPASLDNDDRYIISYSDGKVKELSAYSPEYIWDELFNGEILITRSYMGQGIGDDVSLRFFAYQNDDLICIKEYLFTDNFNREGQKPTPIYKYIDIDGNIHIMEYDQIKTELANAGIYVSEKYYSEDGSSVKYYMYDFDYSGLEIYDVKNEYKRNEELNEWIKSY